MSAPAGAYRGRFAPSPTGAIHLGTARSALIGWLRARQEGGAFVLRMEDLDGPRVRPGAAEAMLRDLRWLGLDWEEGPDVGGPFAPYTQSERLGLYEEALAALRARGRVFDCTCSRKEILAAIEARAHEAGEEEEESSEASAPHGDLGPVYPGTCRAGPSHPERPAAQRFLMPEPPPSFVDGLLGPSPPGLGRGDFVLRRADGVFAYQLAVVVDDHLMGITEVLRGEDLYPSTPRQIALYEALGWPAPAFLHVPIVVGEDGKKLSKRHGAITLGALREGGESAAQVLGALAFGAGLIGAPEAIEARALIERADLSKIRRGATVWR